MTSDGLSPLTEYSSRVLALNPLAYFPCNNKANINNFALDYGPSDFYAYVGYYLGGYTGKYGNAIQCNGGGIQFDQNLTNVIDPNEYSIACWMKIQSVVADQKLIEFWTHNTPDEYSAFELRYAGPGSSNYGVFLRESGVSQSISCGPVAEVTWQHIVMFNSKSAGRAGMYVDGVLHDAARTVPGFLDNTPLPFYPQIMYLPTPVGLTQHIAIFDHALNQTEVNQISH